MQGYLDENGELIIVPEVCPEQTPELDAMDAGHALLPGEIDRTLEKVLVEPPALATSDIDLWFYHAAKRKKWICVKRVKLFARQEKLQVKRMFLTYIQGWVYCEAFYG